MEIDPNHAEAYNLLGFISGQTGDLAGALESLRRAVQLDPTLLTPVITWARHSGIVARELKLYRLSFSAFQSATKLLAETLSHAPR